MLKWIMLKILVLFSAGNIFAESYYVDAAYGADTNSGTSPVSAWKTVRKVNETIFQAGDVIHFRSGKMWRESLKCQSGTEKRPLVYTFYG